MAGRQARHGRGRHLEPAARRQSADRESGVLRLGVDRVFWGVVESRSLVDIVNQTDLVEHPDEKTKLGQPMAHVTWSGDWGALEVFGLTGHRPRTFPGRHGRLRSGLSWITI